MGAQGKAQRQQGALNNLPALVLPAKALLRLRLALALLRLRLALALLRLRRDSIKNHTEVCPLVARAAGDATQPYGNSINSFQGHHGRQMVSKE